MATKPTAVREDEETGTEPAKGGKKKKLIIVGVLVLLLAAGGYFFLSKGDSAEAKEPVPGAVLTLEPITINLADGRYLKLGLALQLTAEAAGGHGASGPDGAPALDLAIALLSNRDMAELGSHEARTKVKAKLAEKIEHAYHGLVMDIYFTEFVMQ